MANKDIRVTRQEFADIEDGRQRALVVMNQNFAIGERVTIREFDDVRMRETDRVRVRDITHIIHGESINKGGVLSPSYAVISLGESTHANGNKVEHAQQHETKRHEREQQDRVDGQHRGAVAALHRS